MTPHQHDPPSDQDPTITLMRAERDGLLQYIGYTTGTKFDVIVSGTRASIDASRAAPLVHALRRIRDLRGAGVPIAVRETDGQGMILDIDGTEVIGLRVDQAREWIDGYMAARAADPDVPRPASTMGQIRTLLTNPSDDDRSRLVLLGLMYGSGKETSASQLAELTGLTKKTVLNYLKFGPASGPRVQKQIPAHMDKLIAALGQTWSDPVRRDGVAGMTRVPQHPGVARLRRIMECEDEGYLTYVDVADPNEARRLDSYRLAVGGWVHQISGRDLDGWLAGLSYCWQNWH